MSDDDWIKRPLEFQYVDGILEKLARTLEKYELIIPEVNEMVREIVSTTPKDHFEIVVTIIEKVMKYKTTSPFMNELAENMRQDFWHGMNKEIPPHKGEFYIDSQADT